MPEPQAICLEDIDDNSENRYTQCVAVPGRESGLGLDSAGQIQWRSPAVAFELWVTAENTLALFRRDNTPEVTVERAGRTLSIPCGKPSILGAGDVIRIGERRLRVHVHGAATAVHEPRPFNGDSLATPEPSPLPPIEIRERPPAPVGFSGGGGGSNRARLILIILIVDVLVGTAVGLAWYFGWF